MIWSNIHKIRWKRFVNVKGYKLIISVSLGLLGCIIGTSSTYFARGDNSLILNYGILFTLAITLAWGRWYGLLSIITGFIFITLHVNAFFGWNGLLPIINLVLWIMCIGKDIHRDFYDYKYYFNLAFSHLIYLIVCMLFYIMSFPFLFRNNNPLPGLEAHSTLQFSTFILLLFRNLVFQTILLASCDVLLLIPLVRKILHLEISKFSHQNFKIISGALAYGLLMCFLVISDDFVYVNINITIQSVIKQLMINLSRFMDAGSAFLIFGGILARIYQRHLAMNEQLQISEAKYRNIFENLNDIYFETTIEGIIITISPSAEKLLGYKADDLVGTNICYLYSDRTEREALLKLLAKNNEINNYQIQIRDVDGKIHNIWIHAKFVRNYAGWHNIIGVFRDVTSFIEEQKKRVESEKNYKLLFDKMMNGFIVMEPVYNDKNDMEDVIFIDTNPSFERITGLLKKNTVGKTWFEIFQYKNRCLKDYQTVLKKDEYIQQELYNPFLKQYHRFGLFKINNNRIGGIFEDITKRKKAEEELKELAANLEAIFESTQDNIWLVNCDYDFITCNQAFINTLSSQIGIKLDNRSDIRRVLTRDALGMWDSYYQKALKEGRFTIEDVFEGNTFEVSLNPIFKDGTAKGIAAFGKNITEYKAAQKELGKLNMELEQRVQERTFELKEAISELEAFTYMVSHDLKSPLRAIDIYSRILIEDYPDQMMGEMKEIIDKITRISRNMIEMIDKLLQYSMRTDNIIKKEPVNLAEMIRNVFEEQISSVLGRSIQLITGSDPLFVWADEILLRRIIENIISNSIKFTKTRNKAVIRVKHTIMQDEVIISVSDNGVGFDNELSGKLFDVFVRLHPTDEFEGSGIGLATVRKIIQLHGGRVWIEGIKDKGATVYFTLPVVP